MNADDAIRVDDGSGKHEYEVVSEPMRFRASGKTVPSVEGGARCSAGCRIHLTNPATGQEQILYGGDWHENEKRLRESRKY